MLLPACVYHRTSQPEESKHSIVIGYPRHADFWFCSHPPNPAPGTCVKISGLSPRPETLSGRSWLCCSPLRDPPCKFSRKMRNGGWLTISLPGIPPEQRCRVLRDTLALFTQVHRYDIVQQAIHRFTVEYHGVAETPRQFKSSLLERTSRSHI